jgi:hypothetical protein
MSGLLLFMGALTAIIYFILIKSYLMNLDEKDKKSKCSKCGMKYSDNNEKSSINNTGKCITCNAIENGRP